MGSRFPLPGRRSPVHSASAGLIAIRALVFIGIAVGGLSWSAWDADRADPDDGANIGLTLIVFLVHAVVAFIWGGIEDRHNLPLRPAATKWIAVGLLTGAVYIVHNQYGEPLNVVALLLDLPLVPIVASLVAGPALIGGLITSAISTKTTSALPS